MCWMAVSGVTHLVVEGAHLDLCYSRQDAENHELSYIMSRGDAIGAVVLDANFYKSTSGNVLMEICAL